MQGTTFPFGNGQSNLEKRHPHIVERLRLLWGQPEGGTYLADLLVDKRGGRAGFAPEVFSELLMLANRLPSLPLGNIRMDATTPAMRRGGFSDMHDASRRRLATA
jgi:hypothetical protein